MLKGLENTLTFLEAISRSFCHDNTPYTEILLLFENNFKMKTFNKADSYTGADG